ncbi:MAG: hypothetical protein WCS43_15945 [Verrucomicrobiota bacterium]
MITSDQLDRAICGRRDERFVAAIVAAKAAGIYDVAGRRLGTMGQEDFFRSVTLDAAEELGIPVDVLDLSRESHIRTLTRVAVSIIRDEIDAAAGSTDNPLSSYNQKTP